MGCCSLGWGSLRASQCLKELPTARLETELRTSLPGRIFLLIHVSAWHPFPYRSASYARGSFRKQPNSLFFPSWIVSNQRSRVSRGRKSVVGHCRVSESLHCPSELRAGVRLAGVVSYQIHNRRNTLHILQDSEKEWYDVPFHYGCFPPLWFEFSMFTSCNPVVEKLQNVQCPLHQWVHQSEGGSRQFSERQYHCHTVITLSPRSNKAVFGAPLLPCPSGRMISNTSPEKVLHSNNYKRSWAVLHLRFFIYVLIKAFPSLSDL